MTRKKKPAPDALPDHRYRITVAGVDMTGLITPGSFAFDASATKAKPKETLKSAIARQVGALTADFDGAGGAELPKPKPDLHTYADALASARKNCPHETLTDTIHSRGEYFCEDCRKYLSRDDMKRRSGSFFQRYFGG